MTTFTISIPDRMAIQIDAVSTARGFATRSEFFRDVIRRYLTKEIALETYTPKPIEEVEKDLTKTGKYNKAFIDSVISGLKKSSAYAG